MSPPSNCIWGAYELKNPSLSRGAFDWVAEKEGFEPPLACAKTVFKTAAFNRSAISPEKGCKSNN